MIDTLVIAFAFVAVGALAVNAWHQVQIIRLIKPTLDASTKWYEAVANYGDIMDAKVERRAAVWKAKVREVLAEAGYMVPQSFEQEPVGDAPPAPNVRVEPEAGVPARQTGRLSEMHEKNREVLRKHDQEATTNARDSVSFQEQGVDV